MFKNETEYRLRNLLKYTLTSYPGGTHMLRHTGMCRQNGLLFQQKSSDMGPILVKKSLEEGPFRKNHEKNVKSAIFELEKPLEMGLDLRKFRKTR